jgi:hypothetical protein
MRALVAAGIAIATVVGLSGCAALLLIPPTGDFSTSGSLGGSGGTGGTSGGAGSGGSSPVVPYSDGSKNEHGYIPKSVNQNAGVINHTGTGHALTFDISLIRDAADECGGTPPTGLHPLEVDISGLLAADAPQSGLSEVSFAAGHWTYFAPGSATPVPMTSGDQTCGGTDPSLSFQPGSSFSLAPYYLVPALTGSIAFTLPDGIGWEWDLASSLS